MNQCTTVKKRSGIFVPKTLPQNLIEKIKNDLTRRVPKYQVSDFDEYKFYLEGESGILVPRFFDINHYIPCKIEDLSFVGNSINIEHNIVPRNELQKKAIEHMLTNDSGIMELQPGVGKTVISICVVAERKRKTLILVHRDSLVDQWKKEIHKFTNLTEDEVVRLTSANYSNALQNPIIITTDQTFVSLLKRDRTNFLRSITNSNIGIFIGDEVHTTVGAPTFSECSIHIPAKVVFGLSATPYRWDGNSDIIVSHLGKVYSEDDAIGTMSPSVLVFLINSHICQKSRGYVYWGGNFQRSRYLNLLKKSSPWMSTIKGLIDKFNDRNIIISGDRIKLLEELYSWYKGTDKSKFIQNAGNEVLKERVVFATTMKVRDGVNVPEKDCLIMTSPVSNIAQIAGRVNRQSPGKKDPIVVDLVDISCPQISSSLNTRIKFYKTKKWNVRFFNVASSGKLESIDESAAISQIRSN